LALRPEGGAHAGSALPEHAADVCLDGLLDGLTLEVAATTPALDSLPIPLSPRLQWLRWRRKVKAPRALGGHFRNAADHRDFAAIGTAAGVATAFAAPIGALRWGFPLFRSGTEGAVSRERGWGSATLDSASHIPPAPLLAGGLLFCIEEGVSFYSTSIFWRGFLATCVGVLTLHILADAKDHPGRLMATKFGRFRDFGAPCQKRWHPSGGEGEEGGGGGGGVWVVGSLGFWGVMLPCCPAARCPATHAAELVRPLCPHAAAHTHAAISIINPPFLFQACTRITSPHMAPRCSITCGMCPSSAASVSDLRFGVAVKCPGVGWVEEAGRRGEAGGGGGVRALGGGVRF
jgi:hypothetical protein